MSDTNNGFIYQLFVIYQGYGCGTCHIQREANPIPTCARHSSRDETLEKIFDYQSYGLQMKHELTQRHMYGIWFEYMKYIYDTQSTCNIHGMCLINYNTIFFHLCQCNILS